jgi:hypothetical protein
MKPEQYKKLSCKFNAAKLAGFAACVILAATGIFFAGRLSRYRRAPRPIVESAAM